jgi:hypothetical protein
MSDPNGRGYAWVDNDGFNTLVQVWDSIRNSTLVSSDPNTLMDVRMNIGEWNVQRISQNQDLTIADRLAGIEKRLSYEKGVRAWDSKDNPISDLGWRAVKKLERFYDVTIGGITPIVKVQNANANEEDFKAAYDALELLMMDETIPDEKKPQAAWDWVDKHITENNNKKDGTDDASAETLRILGITDNIKKGVFANWEANHGPIKSVLESGNQEALKALKDDLGIIVTADMLRQFGIETDLERIAEERGSLDAAMDWLEGLMFWRDN